MLGTYVDVKSGNRAIVQVFEGTSGVDVKKVSMHRISTGARSTV
jgi:vacuolar-type H+-ATPase subunit B/Vma2